MTGAAEAALTPPRSAPRLLVDRRFGAFFAGMLVSVTGIWVHNVAAAILVYDLTGSASLVGAVSVAQFTPQIVLGPLSGAVADRKDRRRQLVQGRVVAALGSFGLMLLLLVVDVAGTAGALGVIGAALVVGIGFAVGGPAMHALVPSLVRPNEMAAAVALTAAPFTIGRAAGPALGAVVLAHYGSAAAFAVAAAGNCFFAAVVWCLPPDDDAIKKPLLEPGQQGAVYRHPATVRAGLAHVRNDPGLVALLLGIAAVGVGADPVVTLAPSLAAHLGQGDGFVAALAMVFGIGAVAAFGPLSLLRARLGVERSSVLGLGLLSVAVVVVAWIADPIGALAATTMGGVGFTLAVSGISTQVHARIPDAMRGRVMSMWMIAFLGTRPAAAAWNGAATDLTSVSIAMSVTAVICAAGALVIRPGRLVEPRS